MKKNSFSEKCYTLLKKVPRGKITTYAELARALHSKGYRAVGNAMHNNPYAPIVPCHRVVKSDGALGGYAGGVKVKAKMLAAEGLRIKNGKVVNFREKLFRFSRA